MSRITTRSQEALRFVAYLILITVLHAGCLFIFLHATNIQPSASADEKRNSQLAKIPQPPQPPQPPLSPAPATWLHPLHHQRPSVKSAGETVRRFRIITRMATLTRTLMHRHQFMLCTHMHTILHSKRITTHTITNNSNSSTSTSTSTNTSTSTSSRSNCIITNTISHNTQTNINRSRMHMHDLPLPHRRLLIAPMQEVLMARTNNPYVGNNLRHLHQHLVHHILHKLGMPLQQAAAAAAVDRTYPYQRQVERAVYLDQRHRPKPQAHILPRHRHCVHLEAILLMATITTIIRARHQNECVWFFTSACVLS
jgi:hypothetical protein